MKIFGLGLRIHWAVERLWVRIILMSYAMDFVLICFVYFVFYQPFVA